MTRFLQAHILTSYPPSNPNRDDLGRPKTCTVGGKQRQRISSQCLKRTWRLSGVFQDALGNQKGLRIDDLELTVRAAIKKEGAKPTDAQQWAFSIAEAFRDPRSDGKKRKPKSDPSKKSEGGNVIAFLSSHERQEIRRLIETICDRKSGPTDEELTSLKQLGAKQVSADVGMFGRMVADKKSLGVDAALQVAHAFTVNEARLDNDYWTGKRDVDPDGFFDNVEQLSKKDDGTDKEGGDGATILGDAEMGSGLYYLYLCVNWDQLVKTTGDEDAARKSVRALLTAATLLAPTGKATQHAHQARARYMMLEQGEHQPRSLAAAFEEPVRDADLAPVARRRLEAYRENLAKVYGDQTETRHFYVGSDGAEGSLDDALGLV